MGVYVWRSHSVLVWSVSVCSIQNGWGVCDTHIHTHTKLLVGLHTYTSTLKGDGASIQNGWGVCDTHTHTYPHWKAMGHPHIHIHTATRRGLDLEWMRCLWNTSAHVEDQTKNIWISRSTWFSGRSFEWRGLLLLTRNPVWNVGHSREKVFDMYRPPAKTCWKFWQSGRAASAGALAPEPPRATRSTPESPYGKSTKNHFFHLFWVEPQVTTAKINYLKSEPQVAKPNKMCWDFGFFLVFYWAGSTRNFEKKTGLSRLNPNFWKKHFESEFLRQWIHIHTGTRWGVDPEWMRCRWHDSFIRVSVTLRFHSYLWMHHVTHMNESCHTYEWVR